MQTDRQTEVGTPWFPRERLESVSEVIASSLIAVSPGLLHSPLCLVHGEARRALRSILVCIEEYRLMGGPRSSRAGHCLTTRLA